MRQVQPHRIWCGRRYRAMTVSISVQNTGVRLSWWSPAKFMATMPAARWSLMQAITLSWLPAHSLPIFPSGCGIHKTAVMAAAIQDGDIEVQSDLFLLYFAILAEAARMLVELPVSTRFNNDLYVGGAHPAPIFRATERLWSSGVSVILQTDLWHTSVQMVPYHQNNTSVPMALTYSIYGRSDKNGFQSHGNNHRRLTITNAPFSNPGSRQFISKLKPDLICLFNVLVRVPSIPIFHRLLSSRSLWEYVYVSGWGGGINVSQGYSTGTNEQYACCERTGWPSPPDGAMIFYFVMERNAQRQLFGSHYGQGAGTDHGMAEQAALMPMVWFVAICANLMATAATPMIFPTTRV